MGWFSRKPRIRIDAGELYYAQLDATPVWEFCLDEEDVEGQTECTMRPLDTKGPLSPTVFSGVIAADLTLANGTRHLGAIGPESATYREPPSCYTCLILPHPAPEVPSVPEPTGYNPYLGSNRTRIDLGLLSKPHPVKESDHRFIDYAYKVLGLTPEQVWPVTIVPRVPIKNWPAKFTLARR